MEGVILLTLVVGFAVLMAMLYGYFGSLQLKQLRTETEFAAEGMKGRPEEYLKNLQLDGARITWIDKEGTVLFDNQANREQMENHLQRPEIQQAKKSGYGSSTRYSKTLMAEMLYGAKKLQDGSFLRIAESRSTVVSVVLGMLSPILCLLVILFIITWLAASYVSKRIVQPLNELNLESPEENEEYPEIAPLLNRIYEQQQEIREKKKALSRTEKDFLAVTENMTEGLILLSDKGKIISINEPAMKLLEANEDCIGEDILFLERRVSFEKALDEAARGKHSELMLTFGNRTFQVDISPVSADNRTAGMVLLLFDVTDRVNAEQMRREFTGNVSHELKTPLHAISGCAELLEQGGVKKEDEKHFIRTIYAEAQRMISLVEDILYISHLDEGAEDMTWEMLDLRKISDETLEKLKTAALKKQISLDITGEAKEVYGIRRLVESIIYNLVDNAIKYNPEKGKVKLTLEDEKDKVTLAVEDTGIGIPKEEQDRIYERFYRVDKSHSREIGGTGLGLSIVKHALLILHAEITLESTLGEGSRFTVTFHKTKERETAEK